MSICAELCFAVMSNSEESSVTLASVKPGHDSKHLEMACLWSICCCSKGILDCCIIRFLHINIHVFTFSPQIFEWWYFRKYGTSFIEQVSVSHLRPLLGGVESTSTTGFFASVNGEAEPRPSVSGKYVCDINSNITLPSYHYRF